MAAPLDSKPGADFLARLAVYNAMSDAEIGTLSTSEIMSFMVVAVMPMPSDVDPAYDVINDAHARFSAEIDLRIPPRL